MMADTSWSLIPESCAPTYCRGYASPSPCGKSEPKTIGSMPTSCTTRCTFSSGNGGTMKWSRKISRGRRSSLPHFAPATHRVRVVELAQDVRQPDRALLGDQHVQVGEPPEQVVHDHAGNGLHRRAVAPVEHPLQPVEVTQAPRRGPRSNRRRTSRSRSARGASHTRTPASLMRAQTGSNIGSAIERPPRVLPRPPCAWPGRNSTIGVPSSMTRSTSATARSTSAREMYGGKKMRSAWL